MSVGLENIVYLFVGRLDVDKGILELVEAYSEVSKKVSNTSLWLVGPAETDIDVLQDLIKKLNIKSILFMPYTTVPETFMAAADVFCLPSRREGFGTVIIEAAACGIPAIGSRIYGLTDAIVDEETGFLVDMGNINALSDKMILLGSDDSLRERLGNTAMKRAHLLYSQEIVVQGLLDFIEDELRHEAATN
jgi:glycosyltransferase involved in cell wall biosynthesis